MRARRIQTVGGIRKGWIGRIIISIEQKPLPVFLVSPLPSAPIPPLQHSKRRQQTDSWAATVTYIDDEVWLLIRNQNSAEQRIYQSKRVLTLHRLLK